MQDFTKGNERENKLKSPLKFKLNQNQGLGQMFVGPEALHSSFDDD